MKNHYIPNRIYLFLAFAFIWCGAAAQAPSKTENPIYRWHQVHPDLVLPAGVTGEYKNYPEAGYTPVTNLDGWSAAQEIQSFANSLSGQLSALYILTVDEKGYVKSVKTIQTNDKNNSDILTGLIEGTRVSGPSYLGNQAVASYIPCSVTIAKNQITVL